MRRSDGTGLHRIPFRTAVELAVGRLGNYSYLESVSTIIGYR